MEYDRDTVDGAVLALLSRTLYQPDAYQAWKGFDWDALDRLHQQGRSGDPKHKSTSVVLTDDGVADAQVG